MAPRDEIAEKIATHWLLTFLIQRRRPSSSYSVEAWWCLWPADRATYEITSREVVSLALGVCEKNSKKCGASKLTFRAQFADRWALSLQPLEDATRVFIVYRVQQGVAYFSKSAHVLAKPLYSGDGFISTHSNGASSRLYHQPPPSWRLVTIVTPLRQKRWSNAIGGVHRRLISSVSAACYRLLSPVIQGTVLYFFMIFLWP